MQTVLGAGGPIADELIRELHRTHTQDIRVVSRKPARVNKTDELLAADLTDPAATNRAVAGSEIAYLTVGLPLDSDLWERQFPVMMRNVIDACAAHGTKLVFFDNVYAYGKVDGLMTEDKPYAPCSKKGELRARIATTLMDEVKRGELQAMIVRAADFYGPGATLSLTHSTVTERLKAGKTPQWVGDAKATHTFTYTPDAGRTVALLGNTASAYGQVWHALTSKKAMSGEAYVRLACELAGKPYGIQVAPRWMLGIMGLFVPVLRENMEMMYQFEHDYRFDSSKVERAFNVSATPYKEGIAAALKA